MADMTAQEAIESLNPVWVSNWDGPDTLEVVINIDQAKCISALIQNQSDEIKRLQAENSALQCCGNCGNGGKYELKCNVNPKNKCDQWRRRE